MYSGVSTTHIVKLRDRRRPKSASAPPNCRYFCYTITNDAFINSIIHINEHPLTPRMCMISANKPLTYTLVVHFSYILTFQYYIFQMVMHLYYLCNLAHSFLPCSTVIFWSPNAILRLPFEFLLNL